MNARDLRTIPLVLVGPGAVGRALLTQIVATRRLHAEKYGLRLAVTAIADADGIASATETELSDQEIARLIGHKGAGRPVATSSVGDTMELGEPLEVGDIGGSLVADRLADVRDDVPILVDTTAADTTSLLASARAEGWRVVLANKIPLTGSISAYGEITQGGSGARWETTVAAALPVVSVLRSVVERGDHVRWVTGALSGTLGYLVHRLEQGAKLSEAVDEARTRGYVEPDPRADLSGLDAGRKALILARALGYDLDLADVSIEGLYPPEWDALDAKAFADRLPEIDDVFSERFAASRSSGNKLRYLAYVGDGGARTELTELAPGTPMLKSHPSDSFVLIESDHFRTNPLVVSGRGGGPKVTAAGVLGDIMSLALD
jgi:homoserine dehydrogenase